MQTYSDTMTDNENREIARLEHEIKRLKEDIVQKRKYMDHQLDWFVSCDRATGALPDKNWALHANTIAENIEQIQKHDLRIRMIYDADGQRSVVPWPEKK